MKVLIYTRCSTDEAHQDVEVQLKELRRYCEHHSWSYDEVSEYGSGYKGDQPKLKEKLEQIKLGHYGILLVWSMDRFSREHPRKVDEILNKIVYDYNCRFIAMADSIDSADEMKWHIMRHMLTYFANIYSRKLSERVKGGIARAKEKGLYKGGRPSKQPKANVEEIKGFYKETSSFRQTAKRYNENKHGDNRISRNLVKQILLGEE